ncbi:proline-rich protein HaeIII subfamily 1-like [Canis lupus familiaris]|uniref:proline-rich protein HaeIII subfamily 1-like n=1 Tax=Canis lupus familiaris TaxID=9615 RepID=UPI0018F7DE04|nr:proline-rich protein HaeIII subfamily 1-like [Canis lupus familiaris]
MAKQPLGPGAGQVGAPAAPGQPLPSPRRNLTRRPPPAARPPPEAPGTRPEPGSSGSPHPLGPRGAHRAPGARRSSRRPQPRPPHPRAPAGPASRSRRAGAPPSRSPPRSGRRAAVPEGPGLDAAAAPPPLDTYGLRPPQSRPPGGGAGAAGRGLGGRRSPAGWRLRGAAGRTTGAWARASGARRCGSGWRGRSGERAPFSTQPGGLAQRPVVRPLRAGPELRSFCRGARPASRFMGSSPPPPPPVGVRARPPRVTQLGAA